MTPTHLIRPWIQAAAFALLLVLGLMLGVVPGRVEAQTAAASKFDHFKTGFPLSGAHGTLRCESCHTNGIFKGTPKDCQTCHTTGSRLSKSNVVMPPTHIPTNTATQTCDSCHGTQTFTNPRFSHTTGVPPGTSCQTCHDGVRTQGKPATHIPTRAACDTCHTTRNWSSGKPDHSGFNTATNCASCHNGATASSKSSNHIPVTANCISCHNVNGWKPTSWSHTQVNVAGACSTCHSGSFPPADGRPGNHIPYQSLSGVAISNCDSCHKGGFNSWNPGLFHANVAISGQCASCHLTTAFDLTAKPATATHSTVTGNCESCHNSTGWNSVKVDHSKLPPGAQCATCHNGSTATGKPGNHIPVSANCSTCHSTTGWKPTNWNHTQVLVAGQCSTCHSGSFPPADGRPGNHIPYQSLSGVAISNCDSCHKGGYSSWNPGRFHSNVNISSQCASCHLLPTFGLTSKPNNSTHTTVTGNCESCHNTSGWAGAKVDHSLFNASTNCTTCHNGSASTGKPGDHIPVTANCYSCHNTSAWTPTKWNHTQVNVVSNCASCHTGKYGRADGKPSTHLPYQSLIGVAIANCDSCHKGGYSSWNPGRFHNNVTISTQCASCHLLPTYGLTSKPNNSTHTTVTGNCENCHNTSGWAGARVDHNRFTAATQCATCHNGSAATGKPGSHIPVTANCYSCHNVTGWTPTKWNHTQVTVTGTCSTCHTGAYARADGKPPSHIPYQQIATLTSANCDSCHKNGYGSWYPGRVHSNVTVTGQCATCHTNSFLGASGKPGNHIPYQQIASAATANCNTCHKSGFGSWGSARFHSNVTVTGQCATCHTNIYAGSGALAKPNNHIPYESQLMNGATMDCNACHTSTNPGGFGTAVMNHNNSQGGGSGWCYACHNAGTAYLGSMERKSLTHQKKTGVTDCSQSGCHRPLGNVGSAYRNWN